MKKRVRIIRALIIAAVMTCFIPLCGTEAFACTGIYVGPEVSTDGTRIVCRSNDTQAVWGNYVMVQPAVEDVPGRMMSVDESGDVETELPETTYRYTATPYMDSTMAINDSQRDAAACINEYGVAMTMSVSAFANDAALKADPLVDDGLTEDAANDLVICQSKTAREAVETLLALVDEYGSDGSNIALIADQKEAWYVEIYTGHQYAAVKLPADKVSAFGNEFTMEYLSDYEESIVSKDLLKLPEENGFAVHGKNRELNLFDTYSGLETIESYCHMRTWIGHQVLAPSVYDEDYEASARYPLCFTPDKKVSMDDVCQLIRNRYEGTEYDPDTTGRKDMRVIGTDTALSVHVLQFYPDFPAEMGCITWESTGPAIYGVFVPVSNAMTSVDSAYGNNQPADETYKFDTQHYPYYAFRELTTLCVEPDTCQTYGKPVRDYWHRAEKGMFAGMPQVLSRAAEAGDPDAAAAYLTAYCSAMQKHAFSDAKQLLNQVVWTQSDNCNTMKMGRNPETDEVLKTERKLPPMKVKLDSGSYADVPEMTEAYKKSGNSGESGALGTLDEVARHYPVLPVVIVIVILAVLLAIVAVARRRKKQ